MLTEQNIRLFKEFGLPIYDEDEEEVELPFEETPLTKEECFDMCRKTYILLQNAGNKPYTLFCFKESCNDLARKKAEWKSYFAICAKYLEYHVYKDYSHKKFERIGYMK